MPKDAMDDAVERLKGALPAPEPAPDRAWERIRESLASRPRRTALHVIARAAAFLAGFAATWGGLAAVTRPAEPGIAAELAPAATGRPDPGPEVVLHRPAERLFEGVQK